MRRINLNNFRVATNVTARDVNRRIILNLVRTRQSISRADVARLTGLQRSTVSLIVDQLIEQGWIVEGEVGRLPRGRRPIYLQLNTERARIVGISVRPTVTTIALADLEGRFIAQESFPTPEDPKACIRRLCRRAKAFIERNPGQPCEGIGVSLPGRVDSSTQRLTFAPNLAWHNVDFVTPLQRATGLSVEVENAANACALAELYFERHTDGVDHLVALTVAEGIGAGIVTNGQLLRGPSGLAGEFGHMTIHPEGPLCRCGNRGCWETYASNRAAVDYYLQARKSSRKRGAPHGRETVTFNDLLHLVEARDPKAVAALEQMAYYLGIGIASLVNGFTPSLIVVVGEITRAWSQVGLIIEQVVTQRTLECSGTRIVPRDDLAQPRLRGTVALVLQKHFGAPAVA